MVLSSFLIEEVSVPFMTSNTFQCYVLISCHLEQFLISLLLSSVSCYLEECFLLSRYLGAFHVSLC
jgi:hypothetical protein